MTKINFQNLPNTTTPVNASNLNQLQTNVENTLNTYSTSEIRIGTWINNKPLYRKVFDIGALPNNDQKTTTTDLNWTTNVVVNIYGNVIRSSDNNVLPINYANPLTQTEQIGCRLTGSNGITIYTGTDRTSFTGTVVLEYIKTTD